MCVKCSYCKLVSPPFPAAPANLFILVAQDDLGAFEAAMSFLLHWGSRLLVTFPQPPVPVLAGMELALRRVDPHLSAHLENISVGALTYGWPLLRTAFSHVFARADWLRLLDRLLANPGRPELLEAAAVGFVVASRGSLLSCRSTGEAEAFFRRLPGDGSRGPGRAKGGDVDEMFRVMDRVARFGPLETWAWRGGDSRGGNSRRGDRDGRERDRTVEALTLLRSAPREFQPLPRGAYPAFDGYPRFVIDYQSELRERVALQERDADRKRQLVRVYVQCSILCAGLSL